MMIMIYLLPASSASERNRALPSTAVSGRNLGRCLFVSLAPNQASEGNLRQILIKRRLQHRARLPPRWRDLEIKELRANEAQLLGGLLWKGRFVCLDCDPGKLFIFEGQTLKYGYADGFIKWEWLMRFNLPCIFCILIPMKCLFSSSDLWMSYEKCTE